MKEGGVMALNEWDAVIRICVAGGLTGILGLEREIRAKSAGLRTFTLVGVGAALFTAAGALAVPAGTDPTRIAAQVASGVGFIGAGLVFQRGSQTHNLTTAAGIWTTAAVGVACGMGLLILATATTVLMLVALVIYRFIVLRIIRPQLPHGDEEPDI
jgi:putative Mg2+ transporter-C (MgtC) family protein